MGTLSWQEFMKKDYSDPLFDWKNKYYLNKTNNSKFNKQIKATEELRVAPTRETQPAAWLNLIDKKDILMYQYKAKITRIVDGDTVDCDIDLGFKVILAKQRIRLYGIDTPESRTRDKVEKKYGLLAKKYLVDFIEAEDYQITLETAKGSGRGKFGRILGKIINKDGQCANEMMCDIGHAMPYFGQSKEDIAAGHIKNRVKINKLIK